MAHHEAVVQFTRVDASQVWIRISGDLDLGAEPDLLGVLLELSATPHAAVAVELGGATFVGASLPNFLVRIRHALGPDVSIVVHRASPMARRILALTDLPQVSVLFVDVA